MRAHQALRCDSVNTVAEAAAIGVTGTVIVGVAGFGASIWNTRKTLAATHKNWIGDQRAIAYLDAIAAVHYRQFSRQVAAGSGPLTEDRRREALAAYLWPDWNVLEARLLAFGSQPAITAMQEASPADLRVGRAFEAWKAASGTDNAQEQRSAYEGAIKGADDADDAFIEQVRTELQGKGWPLGDWEPIAPGDNPTVPL
jgi:hypothetical protein